MAFTVDDLAAIDRAIASGELRIQHNGRVVEYRSIAELQLARAKIIEGLAEGSATGRRPRMTRMSVSKGI